MSRSMTRAFGWILGLVFVASWARVSVAGETADDVHDLVFLGGAQTILVRLHIRIGERPLPAAWRDAVAKLHEHLDSGDAATMAREEELADFAQVLRGPLAIRARTAPESGLDRTFACIDTDGDGKLGPTERERAAKVLRRFDQDDDDAISSAELSAFRDPNAAMTTVEETRDTGEPPVLLLDRSVSRIRTIQQILARFDTGGVGAKAKDQRLSRSEIRLAPAIFRRFDTNRDAALDSVELMQFLEQADPAVELIVRLGPRPAGSPAVELVDRPQPSRGGSGTGSAGTTRVPMRRGDESLVTIDLVELRVDIRTEDTSWDTARVQQNAERLFFDNDLDDDKSISVSEARGQEPFQRLFRLMDRDGNGRIVKGEMSAAVDLFAALWRGHAVLSVKDRGVMLFGNLDTSGDGRLGLRELRAANDQLASFDRNGDGQVTPAEIPRRYELSLAQAPPPAGLVVGDPGVATRPIAVAGPSWFQKMDRNHDGDLSPREFLGPQAEFLRLDADSDGLVDAREASAAR
jgi:Ca2+-binding EF-hand superfamily protein